MRHRLFIVATAISLLLCAVTVVVWIGFSDSEIDEDFFLSTGGGTVWNFSSWDGALSVTHYNGWPQPVRFYHRIQGGDPHQVVSPIFAVNWGGAHRAERRNGKFSFAYGTVCIMLGQDGTVDLGHGALPLLQNFTSQKFSAPFPFWSIGIPSWLAVAIFALLPILMAGRIAMGRLRRKLRTSGGQCPKCGYNLTGNASGICPECGAHIAKSMLA